MLSCYPTCLSGSAAPEHDAIDDQDDRAVAAPTSRGADENGSCTRPFGGEPEPDLSTVDALIDEVERQAAVTTGAADFSRQAPGVAVPRSASTAR